MLVLGRVQITFLALVNERGRALNGHFGQLRVATSSRLLLASLPSLPALPLSFRVSDLSERRHSIPIPRLPSAWCARVPRTTCDVMFRSLFCLLCLGQLATPSPCACGRRKQRTTSKPANTISSVFITFQVRPQGTTRKEGRRRGPFSAGYFGKAGYLSCKRTANPLCHSEGLSATDRCHRYHRQRRARVVVSAGLDG